MKIDISYTEDGQVISKMEIIPQDVWNVDVTASHILAALMKSFINLNKNRSIPAALRKEDALEFCETSKEKFEVSTFFDNQEHWSDSVSDVWTRMLVAMQEGFERYSDFDADFDSEKSKRERRGRELFFRYFENLWD